MQTTEVKKQANGTLFRCHAPDARDVALVGTFNGWNPEATPMERSADGTWKAKVSLPAGRHEFKYVVDGRWCCEPAGEDRAVPDCVPNPFGTMNRVVEVK